MKNVPGTLQEGGAAFPVPHWSLVLDAMQSHAPETAQPALAAFCQEYWPPVYTFLRRRGQSASDAQDLTQAFFVHLLELNTLSRARSDKGRLRTFLLGSLDHFLSDQRDRDQALKRGGGRQIVSMHDPLVEQEAAMFVGADTHDPKEYDRAWATALVRRTWEQLRQSFAEEGKAALFDQLKWLVLGGAETPASHDQLAAQLNLPVATLRTHLHRMRGRYRDLLRAEVARTVAVPTDVDSEMHYLFELLVG